MLFKKRESIEPVQALGMPWPDLPEISLDLYITEVDRTPFFFCHWILLSVDYEKWGVFIK